MWKGWPYRLQCIMEDAHRTWMERIMTPELNDLLWAIKVNKWMLDGPGTIMSGCPR